MAYVCMHSAADDFFLDDLYFRAVSVALEIFREVPKNCLERAELPDEPLAGGRFGDESSAAPDLPDPAAIFEL